MTLRVGLCVTIWRVVARASTTITRTRLLFLWQLNEVFRVFGTASLVSDCPRHACELFIAMIAAPYIRLFPNRNRTLLGKVPAQTALVTLVGVSEDFPLEHRLRRIIQDHLRIGSSAHIINPVFLHVILCCVRLIVISCQGSDLQNLDRPIRPCPCSSISTLVSKVSRIGVIALADVVLSGLECEDIELRHLECKKMIYVRIQIRFT